MLTIRKAFVQDADWLQSSFDSQMGWTKPPGYFAACCHYQLEDRLVLLIAIEQQAYRGHCKVVWSPDYVEFRENGIPEIQDLNVLPAHRRRGVATQLMDQAESLIRQRSAFAGIGVGLYADYGPAQRLYGRRGYVPDGKGVMAMNRPVPPGELVLVNDDLILYLIKEITNSERC